MSDKYIFSITTLDAINNRKLGSLVPDKDGYYLHPAAVVNHTTENDTFYEPEKFLDQMTSKDNIFRKNLERGNLYGEADHPDVKGTIEDIPRLLHVQMDRVSHHIKEVRTTPLEEVPGAYLVLLKVKPHGKFGEYLKESFESEFVNTTFSLRSVVREATDPVRKRRVRHIVQLVTFDWVTVPGSPEASKRYSNIGVESYSKNITAEMLRNAATASNICSGMESFSESYVKKLLGDLEIKVTTQNYEINGFKNPGELNYIDKTTGDKRSVLHAALKTNGGII